VTALLLPPALQGADLRAAAVGGRPRPTPVLAPTNAAFDALAADALNALLADQDQLTAVLTDHVIEGRPAPDELAGTHIPLNGDDVTIEGSGEDFSIAGTLLKATDASVVCRNCSPPTRPSTSSTRCSPPLPDHERTRAREVDDPSGSRTGWGVLAGRRAEGHRDLRPDPDPTHPGRVVRRPAEGAWDGGHGLP
jgi:hypothetical protein